MDASTSPNSARSTAFESFGVRLRVTADTPAVIERIRAMLPPDARRCPPSTAEESFGVLADDGGSYRFERGDELVSSDLELEVALLLLENQLRTYIGLHAPSRIFVRAGVVACEGRAIVIPGLSMAGKTTLVLELVRGGADYYSDEFAVLDERGLVHPYPTTPSVREPVELNDVDIQRLNREQDDGPLTIGAVVLTAYRPGAEWKPTRVSTGRGALVMLEHTPAASRREKDAMRVISRAIDEAVVLEGERGEARELVPQLLSALSTRSRK